MNTETHFCLRVDVDTFEGLKKGIPEIFNIVKKIGIPITVYLSLGKYSTGRNLFRRIKHGEKISFKLPPWKRNSLRSMMRGVILPSKSIKDVEREFLRNLSNEELVEIHPHGCNHVNWSSKFSHLNLEQTENYMLKMISEYKEIFGINPIANAAPSFQTNNHYFRILEDYNFDFSSDFRFHKPFNLDLKDKNNRDYKCKVPQLPVTELSFDELLLKGKNVEEIKEFYKQRFRKIRDENIEYACLYVHAVFEPLKLKNLLEDVLNIVFKCDMKPNSHKKYSQEIKELPSVNLAQIRSEEI